MFTAVSIVKRVNVDPLDDLVWGKNFAIMEPLYLWLPVVGWCSHVWGVDKGLSLISIIGVFHVVPEPQWTSIVWSFILTNDEFLSKAVISSHSFRTGHRDTKSKGSFVDSLAMFFIIVGHIKIGIWMSRVMLHLLGRHDLCLGFMSGIWEETSISNTDSIIVVFRNSPGIKSA